MPGSVHGVVVQITALTRVPRSAGTFASSAACASAEAGKRTSMDGLSWLSSYSISASASAVRSVMHQCTDFLAL